MGVQFDSDVPPPWVVYPLDHDPAWSGWRQGTSEGWLTNEWSPFWMGLDSAGQAAYLERWPPPDLWRTHLRAGAVASAEPLGIPDLRRRDLVVDGIRSPLVEGGPADADEAVVFLHDIPGMASNYLHLLAAASNWGRVLAFDMPGFGRADRPAGFINSVEGLADHLQRALAHLSVHRAHLVLHGFSGLWGLTWAAARPASVGSVTLFNSGLLLDYRWPLLDRLRRRRVVGELLQNGTTRGMFRAAIRRSSPRLSDIAADEMAASHDSGTRKAVLDFLRAAEPARTSAALARALSPKELPALVMWGKLDRRFPWELAARQLEGFPDARIHLLDHSGHWPFVDDRDLVLAAFIPFLRSHLRPRA
jgi:pimeloyl-ACP methyl ester carboxylesterase